MAAGPGESFELGLSGATIADTSEGEELAFSERRVDRTRFSGSLRNVAARGLVINAIFMVAMNALGFIKGFGVAAFLTPKDYGTWGLLAVAFTTLYKLVGVGVDDKYIQQDDDDQESAFYEAFTMQSLLCGAFLVVISIAIPLFAWGYDEWSIVLPGYCLALVVPAMALQTPLWVFYRKMEFGAQRRLQCYDPIVSLVVTIGLAAAGAGYWALIAGVVAGGWTAALVAVRASPYKLRWKFRRATLREYWHFSGPLFYSAIMIVIIGQVPVLVGTHVIGLVGVGAMGLANNISQYSTRVDDIISNTLYPAVCAVKDRVDLMKETFMKSNRLALLWSTPLGIALALFGPDFVAHVFGPKWHAAIYPLQAFGIAAVINQIGFNWAAFYRALGDTKPLAVNATIMCVSVIVIAIPLLVTHGLNGYATGMGIALFILTISRVRYLARLFPLREIATNSAWGIFPTLPAVAAVLILRWATWGGERSVGQVVAEILVFGAVLAAVTFWAERPLLKEFRGYLSGRGMGIRSSVEPSQPA